MKLDPFQFEQFCANVLNANGYHVFATKKTGDGGKDLVGINDKSESLYLGRLSSTMPVRNQSSAAPKTARCDGR